MAKSACDSTFGVSSGKWFMEIRSPNTSDGGIGFAFGNNQTNVILGTDLGGSGSACGYRGFRTGNINYPRNTTDGTGSYFDTWTSNTPIGVAVDLDGGNMKLYASGSVITGSSQDFTFDKGPYRLFLGKETSAAATKNVSVNFGQDASFAGAITAGTNTDQNGYGAFNNAVPSGYLAMCTANLAAPAVTDPSAQFQTELYTGNGTAIGSGGKAVTFTGNSDMQPDLVWIKNRDATDDHAVYDSTRGTTKQIETNNTDAETTQSEGLTTFGSDGFTVGSLAQVNTNTEDFVSWNWKEGATPGFDIVTWTGNATNRTISHSLGVVPNLMIVKGTSAGTSNRDWMVYHSEMSSAPETDYMRFDSTQVVADAATIWNDTAPTSSVFSVGTGNTVNENTETYVGYLWANVEGFSKFGSYIGTGTSDDSSPFANCGFKPNWVLIKNTGAYTSWAIWDIARDTYNQAEKYLLPDSNAAEATAGGLDIDILSNGFKIRGTDSGINTSSGTYIFAAFAENPFGGSGVAPAPAR